NHREHGNGKIGQKLKPVIRIPFAANRHRELISKLDLLAKMLDKEPDVVRKIWINYVPKYQPRSGINQRPPFEPTLVPDDDRGPYHRRNKEQREQAVGPNKSEHQRQQPNIFPLKKQIDSRDRDDYC